MNYLEDDIKFFSRLVNGSKSGVIASAEQVKDYNWNQGAGAFQNVINNYLKEQIDLKNETISAEDREVLNYLKLIKNGLVTNEQGILNYSENSVEIGTSNGGNSQNPTKTAVIIAGANSEHAGLMTAQDKRKLDTLKQYCDAHYRENRDDLDAILNGDKPIIYPQIAVNQWTYTRFQQTPATSTATSIIVPVGSTVTYKGQWKWTRANGYKNPTTCTTTLWGSILPESGVLSQECDIQTFTSATRGTKTFSVTVAAPKKGLMLNGSKIVSASGTDTASASVSCKFSDYIYWGNVLTQNLTASNITSLNSKLADDRTSTITVTTDNSQYFCYAYPANMGKLSTIIADGSDPILGNFKEPIQVSIQNGTGAAQNYYVYVSMNKGAFNNTSLEIK